MCYLHCLRFSPRRVGRSTNFLHVLRLALDQNPKKENVESGNHGGGIFSKCSRIPLPAFVWCRPPSDLNNVVCPGRILMAQGQHLLASLSKLLFRLSNYSCHQTSEWRARSHWKVGIIFVCAHLDRRSINLSHSRLISVNRELRHVTDTTLFARLALRPMSLDEV